MSKLRMRTKFMSYLIALKATCFILVAEKRLKTDPKGKT